jgi:hypothetical protein
MSLDHDPELPAGFQDADLEQAAYEAQGRATAALHRRGICTHGWMLGPGNVNRSRDDIDRDRAHGRFPDRVTDPAITCQDDIPHGRVLCLDCGSLIDDPCPIP